MSKGMHNRWGGFLTEFLFAKHNQNIMKKMLLIIKASKYTLNIFYEN